MENTDLQQKWPALMAKIKEQYPHITDEELTYKIGEEAQLLLHLQEKLGKNKKEMDNWLNLLG